jgi:pullulanase/glycogen debranching enzyme
VVWAKHYRIDGFRFDLMGHHSVANMREIRAALDALTPVKDGVAGKAIYAVRRGLELRRGRRQRALQQATQGQLGGTDIGTFSDRLRDAVRGGGPFDDDPRASRASAPGWPPTPTER